MNLPPCNFDMDQMRLNSGTINQRIILKFY